MLKCAYMPFIKMSNLQQLDRNVIYIFFLFVT